MYFILIRGCGGAGKTTVSNLLAKELRKDRKVALFNGDFFYWDVAGRDPNPKMLYGGLERLTDLYLSDNYNCIVEGIFTRRDNQGNLMIKDLFKVAENYKAEIRSFNLTAPYSVLKDRQIKKYSKNGWNYTDKDFENYYQASLDTRFKQEIEIDTSNNKPDKILNQILKKL